MLYWAVFVASQSFPYVKKRIMVASRKEVDVSPIEVAIEQMNSKVAALQMEVYAEKIDLKKLQLKLQGTTFQTFGICLNAWIFFQLSFSSVYLYIFIRKGHSVILERRTIIIIVIIILVKMVQI